RHGFEVYVPPQQGCCGALAWHIGDERSAAACARRNLQAFPAELEHVVTTAAGCGSGIHDYPLILAGAPDEARARELAAKTIDISVLLERYGIEPPPPLARPLRVAYHDACHLSHAQRVRSQPRNLLKKIPNLTLIELEDGELCCGSAGTYNLDQPAIAAELGRKKA
ncbi:MAG: (Fe-S)-binding protein, partial [Pirellulaceae bacterium]